VQQRIPRVGELVHEIRIRLRIDGKLGVDTDETVLFVPKHTVFEQNRGSNQNTRRSGQHGFHGGMFEINFANNDRLGIGGLWLPYDTKDDHRDHRKVHGDNDDNKGFHFFK
jgi:hypothetical protein